MSEEGSFDVVDNTGALTEGWMDKAPDDVKEAIGDSKYFDSQKDFWGVVKSAAGLSKKIGEKPQIPTNESTDEEWAEHLTKIGALKEGEEYKHEFKDLSDDQRAVIENKENMDTINGMLKDSGVPARLASRFVQEWMNKVVEQNKAADEALQKRVDAQKEAWGDNFAENTKVSDGAYKSFLNDDQRSFLEEVGLADHPVMKSIMLEVGNRIKTGRVLPGEPGSGNNQEEGGMAEMLGITAD